MFFSRTTCTPIPQRRLSAKNQSAAGFLLLFLMLSLPLTRQLSGINLVLISAIYSIYLIYKKKVSAIPRSLLALSGLGLLYVALSSLDAFPQTWTKHFQVDAIPQQALFSYALPTTFGLAIVYLRKHLTTTQGRLTVAKKLILFWGLWRILSFFFNPYEARLTEIVSIATMGNMSALAIVAICLYLTTIRNSLKKYAVISIFIILSALSPFSQNLIYSIIFILIWAFPKQAILISTGFIVCSVSLYIAFYSDPFALQSLDNNMPIRLILIRDALAGLVQSYGLGVGFGTESITNDYTRLGILHFQSDEAPGFIHLAAHNSFATIAFRLGFIGFIILLLFCAQTYNKIKDSISERDIQAKCSLFVAFFILAFTNPALESFGYLYGACLYLSVVWALPGKYAKN